MPVFDGLRVDAFTVPTDLPEADGTFAWESTTLVVVHLSSEGQTGIGYTYSDTATAHFIEHYLAPRIVGQDVLSPPALNLSLSHSVRNLGREGIVSTAISAVDMAAWDLKARIFNRPITAMLGAVRDSIAVYGSGGFTSYSDDQLAEQLGHWVGVGIEAVKMKVGTAPERDPGRVRAARHAIGKAQLYVDANGAYDLKQASAMAQRFADSGVVWFEEPVSSDNLRGLRFLRSCVPSNMEIAAGEYGYTLQYFRKMLEASAVDVLQADATRCGGVTGFLNSANLAAAFDVPLSAHTAPSLHGHLCCVASKARNVEYFHDHVRIEKLMFDGALEAREGQLRPDPSAAGYGLTLKVKDAVHYRVYSGGTS